MCQTNVNSNIFLESSLEFYMYKSILNTNNFVFSNINISFKKNFFCLATLARTPSTVLKRNSNIKHLDYCYLDKSDVIL